jgi:predicted unusual protein kinase regulating ubiquinone biosynthesis (AarF/ABC1/UbiB family)
MRELPTPRPVPANRLSRQVRLGGMAGGIAAATLGGALGQMLRGRGPDLAQAALTPANAARLAGGLAHLRGAAMKLGQMLSMETGHFLPPEVTGILSQLRDAAPAMPPAQLKQVLAAEWGADWLRHFARFDVRPIAAASIGQVHRAQTRDGRDLAIKVQFPGVADSIGPDIATLGQLLRLPGVLPRDLDPAPLLASAEAQLRAEADYAAEGRALSAFGAHLVNHAGFVVPRLHPDFSTGRVLAMDFIDSLPIDALADAPQSVRDRVAQDLIALVLRELFDLHRMQTDPNLANYRVTADERIVLLDFGATQDIAPETATTYRALLRALLMQDRDATGALMTRLGYFAPGQPPDRATLIVDLADFASRPLRQGTAYDFATSTLIPDLAQRGQVLGQARDFWHIPPADLLFLHRKIGGMFLLAQRLRARVALPDLLAPYA